MKKKNFLTIIVTLLIVVVIIIANIVINKKQAYSKSDFILDSDNKYKITTNMRWKTMQNDGGSNIDVYYQIDFDENKVIKCQDEYVGFKGYKYEAKILYSKILNEKDKEELKLILDNIISNISEEIENLNYNFYTLSSFNNKDINIYDENIIERLETLLAEE